MAGIISVQANLLQLFERPQLSPPETLFAARAFLECSQSQNVPGSWKAAKFSAASGRLGRALASLNDRLPAERDMARVASMLEAASITALAILTTGPRLHPPDAASFCHAADLFMCAGIGFLGAWLDTSDERGPRAQQARALAAHSMVVQARAVRCLVDIASAPGISGAAMPVLLRYMQREDGFNQWLACMSILALKLLAGAEVSLAGSRQDCLADLSHVCRWALVQPSALQQDLHADPACQTQALRMLLLQALPAAANRVLPPASAARDDPQLQPPTADRLAFLSDVLMAISSPCMEPARVAHYRQQGSRGLLRWAQRVLTWLPLEALQSSQQQQLRALYTDVCIAALGLLSEVSWWAEEATARQADQQATYEAALHLLPKAAAALRLLATNQLPGADPAQVPTLFVGLANVALMADTAVRQKGAGSPEQCTAACAAAAACLRMLPLLATLELARASSGPAEQEGVYLGGAAIDVTQGIYCRVAFGAISLWHIVVWRASTSLAAGCLTPASRAALRLLHTTSCRLVAWRATPPATALLDRLDPELQEDASPWRFLGTLQVLYCDVLLPDRAVCPTADAEEEEEGGGSEGEEEVKEPNERWLRGRHGVSCAHWEAVQTLLPLLPAAALAGCPRTAGSLVIVCTQMLAPAAPTPCGHVVALLSRALGMLPEGTHSGHHPPSDLSDYMLTVIQRELATSYSRYSAAVSVANALQLMRPQQLAAVVSSGLLAQVLTAVAAAAQQRPDAAFYGARFVMHTAIWALKRVLEAARASPAASTSGSARGSGNGSAGTGSGGASSSTGARGIPQCGSSAGRSSRGGLLPQLNQLEALLLEMSGQPPPAPANRQHDARMQAMPWLAWMQRLRQEALPLTDLAAEMIEAQAREPGQVLEARMELARAAATRSCAHLRCPNLALEGGPAAGAGVGCKRCAGCRALWYCSDACQRADWALDGHRRVCKALAAARQESRQARLAAREVEG